MQRKHFLSTSLIAASLLAPAWAAAQDDVSVADDSPASSSSGNAVEVDARYRFWGEALDVANFEGGESGSQDAVYQNLRAGVTAGFGSLKLRLETDAFTGRLAGDEPAEVPDEFMDSGTRADTNDAFGDVEGFVDPRAAYLELRSFALLRVGLQASNFGMGMVANDGTDPKRALFNQRVGGDRGLRVLLGTRPFAFGGAPRTLKQITLGLGGDMVFRDDNASFIDGDRARQFISSVYYEDSNPRNPDESRFLGAYFAYRDQTDDPSNDGDYLRAAAFDISGKTTWNDDADLWYYSLGFESALLTGKTNRTYPQSAADRDGDGEPETGILALGAAAEAEVRWKALDLSMILKTGYASGDANADDDRLYRFRFDPNYKVGLILFDHYIPAVTRTGYYRASDPERSGAPPKGVEGLISDGAVENAVFVNPMLLFGDEDGLLTGVGFLWAQSAVPLADPYNSFANGGSPVGPRGAAASRDLGVEVDVAAQYRFKIVSDLKFEAKAEYGILFPGKAFNDAAGDQAAPQNLVRGRLALLW